MASIGHIRLFYRGENGTNFIVTQPMNHEPAIVANGSTVAFSCSSLEQVRQFHDVAVENGSTSIEAAPGLRHRRAMATIDFAHVCDPDGNKLCAIHISG
jgi:hypothetical protein